MSRNSRGIGGGTKFRTHLQAPADDIGMSLGADLSLLFRDLWDVPFLQQSLSILSH
jgi:hypothetical protein